MVRTGMTKEMDAFDIGAIVAALSIFVLYHVNLYLVAPNFNANVPFLFNRRNASLWILKHKVLHDTATTTLAIQTLRNTMIVAVFIGGYALQYAYDFSSDYPNIETRPMQARSVIIMASLFTSFLCWANVIRLASQLGFLIGSMQHLENQRDMLIKERDAEARALKERGEALLAREDDLLETVQESIAEEESDVFNECESMIKLLLLNFSIGFRLIFLSLPFAFYSVGPLALVISMGCLLLFFVGYDSRNRDLKKHK